MPEDLWQAGAATICQVARWCHVMLRSENMYHYHLCNFINTILKCCITSHQEINISHALTPTGRKQTSPKAPPTAFGTTVPSRVAMRHMAEREVAAVMRRSDDSASVNGAMIFQATEAVMAARKFRGQSSSRSTTRSRLSQASTVDTTARKSESSGRASAAAGKLSKAVKDALLSWHDVDAPTMSRSQTASGQLPSDRASPSPPRLPPPMVPGIGRGTTVQVPAYVASDSGSAFRRPSTDVSSGGTSATSYGKFKSLLDLKLKVDQDVASELYKLAASQQAREMAKTAAGKPAAAVAAPSQEVGVCQL